MGIPKMLARRPMIAEHHPTTFSPASSIMANSMIVSQLQLAFRQRVLSAMPRLANMAPRTANLVVSLVGASPAACLAPSLLKRLSQHALASLPRLQNHAMSRRLLRSSWSAEHAQAMRQLPLVIPKMLARRPMIAEHHPTTFSPASSIMANSMIVSQLQLAFRQRVL